MVTIRIPEEAHAKLRVLTARERRKWLYESLEGAIDRAIAALDAAEALQRERKEEGR